MAAARQTVVGGVGQSIGLDDLVRVARGESSVVLDTAACDRIKKESPPPAKGAPAVGKQAAAQDDAAPSSQPAAVDARDEAGTDAAAPESAANSSAANDATADVANGAADDAMTEAANLSADDVRAALLARLLPLINGQSKVTRTWTAAQERTMQVSVTWASSDCSTAKYMSTDVPAHHMQVRLGVIQLLARYISSTDDKPPVRAADTDAQVLAQLADGITSVAMPEGSDDEGNSAALSPAEQAVLSGGLNPDERQAFRPGQPVTAGIGALFVHDGQRLLTVANSVAALSAEALQAQVPAAVSRQRSHQTLLPLGLPITALICSNNDTPSWNYLCSSCSYLCACWCMRAVAPGNAPRLPRGALPSPARLASLAAEPVSHDPRSRPLKCAGISCGRKCVHADSGF